MNIRKRVFRFAIVSPIIFTIMIVLLIGVIFVTKQNAIKRQNQVRAESVRRIYHEFLTGTTSYAEMISSTKDVQDGAELDMRHYVKRVIDPLYKSLGVDVLIIHERDGYVIAQGQDPQHFGQDESNLEHVAKALEGRSMRKIITYNGKPTMVTTRPVPSANLEGKSVGACTVGYVLDEKFAQRIQQLVGAEIIITTGGNIQASTVDLSSVLGVKKKRMPVLTPGRKLIIVGDKMMRRKWYDLTYVPLQKTADRDEVGLFLAVDNTDEKKALLLMLLGSLGVIVGTWIVVVRRARNFSRDMASPVARVAQHARRVAGGELDVPPLEMETQDELAELASDFNVMVSNLCDMVDKDKQQREYLQGEAVRLLEVMDAAAGGDLTVHFEVTERDEIGRVGEALNKMIHDLRDMIAKDQERRDYLEAQIKRLMDVINIAARGDFSVTFEAEQDDEFARLGQALNSMISDLRDMIAQDKQSRRALEDKVAALLQGIDTVAHGDLSYTFPSGEGDAFARIGQALNMMIADLVRKMEQVEELKSRDIEQRKALEGHVDEILKAVECAAEGDLTVRLHAGAQGAIAALREHLNDMLGNLMSMIAQVHESARRVERTCRHINDTTRELEQGATSQKQTIESTTESVDGLVESISTMASHAEKVMKISAMATEEAHEGGATSEKAVEGMQLVETSMNDLHEVMEELDASAEEIDEVVKVIDDISDQTNLLALNASIEAARAGDLGRGFAVVAREVGVLAQQSVTSTREITLIVSRIKDRVKRAQETAALGRKRVQEGSTFVHKAGAALEGIVLAVDKVTRLIRETVNALDEQKADAGQILEAMKNVKTVSEESAVIIQRAADAVGSLFALAGELEDMVNRFKIDSAQ